MNDEKKEQSYECIHDDCEILHTDISILFDRNRGNIEPHQLIWLDGSYKDDFVLRQLRVIIDYVKTFNNWNECRKYIEKTSNTTTFFITSGVLGQQILPHIHKHDHIKAVYIFCKNKSSHLEWSLHFSKVKNICTEFNELFNNLSQDVDAYLKRYHLNELVEFQLVDGIDNSTDSESFKWLSHLVDFLSWIPYSISCRQQLVDALKMYYDGNSSRMAVVEEFERTYSQDAAIRWYTRPTFVFPLLNRALRQRNIPVIFLFGFFLKDLHNQLKEEYEKYRQSRVEQPSLKVYRGQFISKYEIEKLNNIGWRTPLVINSFLSTTTDRAVAMCFQGLSHDEDELTCIVFEIEISFDKPCLPFADVSHLSHFADEQEVLFSIGTLFQLQEIRYDECDRVWIGKLTLHDRISVADNASVMKTERQQFKEKLTDFINLIFNSTFEEIHVIFEQIMRLFPLDKWISAIKYSCLGEKYWFDGNNDEALKYYQLAIHIWLNYSSDDELNSSIDIAELYERIAQCYRSVQKWTLANENFELAICFYYSVIEQAETVPLQKAFLYRQCARIYEEQGNISHRSTNLTMAIKHHENELAVLFEHCPLSNDNIRSCYTRLGANYRDNSDYCRAFKCYESALNIHLQDKELSSLSIYKISQQLVELCSKEEEADINLMLKYQLLAHEHLLIAHSPIDQEWQRNIIAASHDKFSDLYEASNQPKIASEHRTSVAKLRGDSKVSSS